VALYIYQKVTTNIDQFYYNSVLSKVGFFISMQLLDICIYVTDH